MSVDLKSVDLKIIPKESANGRFLRPGTLDRFELSCDGERRSVTAVFVNADGKVEGRRTLTWEPSKGCIHSVDESKDVGRSLAKSILDFWTSSVGPADAKLMRQQLGLLVGDVELPDEGADT